MSSVTNSSFPQGPQAEISPRRKKPESSKEGEEAFITNARNALKTSSKVSTSASAAIFGALCKGAVVVTLKDPVKGTLASLGIDQATSTARQYADKGVDSVVESRATTVVLNFVKKAYDFTVNAYQDYWKKT